MIEERHLREIESDIRTARASKIILKWQPEELAIDMLFVSRKLIIDIEKYLVSGMEAPAKRIRSKSKILETLGKSYRVQSVKIKNPASIKRAGQKV
jgi:hypothetical protein